MHIKTLLVFFVVGLASWSLRAAPVTVELTSAEGLKAMGVTCRRIELQALTTSVEIDVTVDGTRTPGKYVGAECIVLKEPLVAEKLPALDAGASAGDTVARRARSTKPDPAFLVLGREIPRAYLAFEFSIPGASGGTTTQRYLLPVSAIGEEPAEPAPEPAVPVREAPFLR